MKRIIINKRNNELSAVVLENGNLVEIMQETHLDSSLLGNIYAAVVKNKTMDFIFLDIGTTKQAFLDCGDHREEGLFNDGRTVKQGDTLIVQIIKDSVGKKGPVGTSEISLVGKFIVLLKSNKIKELKVSKKIKSQHECERLKKIGESIVPIGFSAIFRSASEGKDEILLKKDIELLLAQFEGHESWQFIKGPSAILLESPLIRILRDICAYDADEIVLDDLQMYNEVMTGFKHLFADSNTKICYYESEICILRHFSVQNQIDKLSEKHIWLKCGGYIVIEKTEACTVIDVNTGKMIGKKADSLKLRVNYEAALEIARQLRLRNISGIIIIDFISMKSQEQSSELTKYLQEILAQDRIPSVVVGMTKLGLMEVTRKRARNYFDAFKSK